MTHISNSTAARVEHNLGGGLLLASAHINDRDIYDVANSVEASHEIQSLQYHNIINKRARWKVVA